MATAFAPPPGPPASVLVPPPSDPSGPGTVVDLGRKVKAKYPQYSQLDDADLGRRIQAKYPEYANFTDVPGSGFAPLHIPGALSGPTDDRTFWNRFKQTNLVSGVINGAQEYLQHPLGKELSKADAALAILQAKPNGPYTAEENVTINEGMNAHLQSADDASSFSGPGQMALDDASNGKYGAAAGDIVGGYGTPAALGAVIQNAPRVAPYVAPATKGFVKGGIAEVAAHPRLTGAAGVLTSALGGILGNDVRSTMEGGLLGAAPSFVYGGVKEGSKAIKAQRTIQAARQHLLDNPVGPYEPVPSTPGPEMLTPPPGVQLQSGRIPGSMATAPVTPAPVRYAPPVPLQAPPAYTPPAPIMSIKGDLPTGRKPGGIHNQTESTPPTSESTSSGSFGKAAPPKPTPEEITGDYAKSHNITPEMIQQMTPDQMKNLKTMAKHQYDLDRTADAVKKSSAEPSNPSIFPPPPSTPVEPTAPAQAAPLQAPPGGGSGVSKYKKVVNHDANTTNKEDNLHAYFDKKEIDPAKLDAMTNDEKNAEIDKAYDWSVEQGLPVKGRWKKIDPKVGSDAWDNAVERRRKSYKPPGS